MALIKKGTLASDPSDIIISESVYCCSSCGHTDVLRAKDVEESGCLCSKCGEVMNIISNSSRPDEEPKDTEDTEAEETD
jgi:hypothetical protein